MNYLKFSNEKLQLEEITNLVASEKCGAITTFIGTTRDNFDGKNVVKLEYEAYESMAIKSMETICNDIRKQWVEVENIAIYHRLGTVPVKESSIIIAISSPHRADAIKAVEWCIDNVKKSVPIWKKEIYDESPGVWKENKELNPPSKKFRLIAEQEVEVSSVAPHFIQIKAPCEEIEQRIANFMERKRDEINAANVRDFCQKIVGEEDEFSCARRDSVLIKRKDSKGHLQVNKIYNNYNRDQNSQNYLSRLIPKNGIAERIVCLESQLSLTKPTPRDIYKRLQSLENRLLHLESISPEYIHFWDRVAFDVKKVKKKKIYNLEEIDEVIKQLEMQK